MLDSRPVTVKPSNPFAVTASADNAASTATKAAVSGKINYITSVTASFSLTKSGLLQIKDGSTVVFEVEVYDSATIQFPTPIAGTSGNAVSATLAASGTSGTLGKVNLVGFTEVG